MIKYIILATSLIMVGLLLLRKYNPPIYSMVCRISRKVVTRIIRALIVLVTGESAISSKATKDDIILPYKEKIKELSAVIEKQSSRLLHEKASSNKLQESISLLKENLVKAEKEKHELIEQKIFKEKTIADLMGRFTPVNITSVAKIFCSEFYEVSGMLKEVEAKILNLVSSQNDDTLYKLIFEYFNNKPQECDDIHTWYLTLNGAGVLTGTAGMDVRTFKRDEDVLIYLRRHAFTEYYRPLSSHLLLLLERIRNRVREDLVCTEYETLSDYLISSLSHHNVDVIYLQSGMIYTLEDYSNLSIKEANNGNHPANYIEEVLHYGVNHREFDIIKDKTEVRMCI